MRTLLLLCLSLAGCAVNLTLPNDFLVLQRPWLAKDLQALTGDDARVWVRQFDEASGGDLEFWLQTVRRDLTERGYQFVQDGECVDAAGSKGRWLEAAVDLDGERGGYLLALWVGDRGIRSGSQITTLEFTARESTFAARREAVMAALATLRR